MKWLLENLTKIVVAVVSGVLLWLITRSAGSTSSSVAPVSPPGVVDTFSWLPLLVLFIGGGVVSPIAIALEDELPVAVLALAGILGAGFAIWAAVLCEKGDPPLPVMVLLALSAVFLLGYGLACLPRELRFGVYANCSLALIAGVFLILWEIGTNGAWVDFAGRISDGPGPFHATFAVLSVAAVIFSVQNILGWLSPALAVIGVTATVASDSNNPETSPLGLSIFASAVILGHLALRGKHLEDLPKWVLHSLVYVKVLGGFALIALGLLGFATNGNQNEAFNWSALGLGVVGLIAAAVG